MAEKATHISKIDKNNQKGRAISLMTAVNLSEMKTSNNPAETLVAFSISAIKIIRRQNLYYPHIN